MYRVPWQAFNKRWALTVGAAGGVAGLMDYFNRELVNTMLHLGVDNVSALGREHVSRASG